MDRLPDGTFRRFNRRVATCKKCGFDYNISAKENVPPYGYFCPCYQCRKAEAVALRDYLRRDKLA